MWINEQYNVYTYIYMIDKTRLDSYYWLGMGFPALPRYLSSITIPKNVFAATRGNTPLHVHKQFSQLRIGSVI